MLQACIFTSYTRTMKTCQEIICQNVIAVPATEPPLSPITENRYYRQMGREWGREFDKNYENGLSGWLAHNNCITRNVSSKGERF